MVREGLVTFDNGKSSYLANSREGSDGLALATDYQELTVWRDSDATELAIRWELPIAAGSFPLESLGAEMFYCDRDFALSEDRRRCEKNGNDVPSTREAIAGTLTTLDPASAWQIDIPKRESSVVSVQVKFAAPGSRCN